MEEYLNITSSGAIKEECDARIDGREIQTIRITRIDRIPHVYDLAELESRKGILEYYDRPDIRGNITRTNWEKRFHLCSGKIAELEFQRQCETNRGYRTVRGVSLLAGKPDDGIDYIYEYDVKDQNGRITGTKQVCVQIKYRHGLSFSIKAEDIKCCADKELELIVVRCEPFYKNYRPRTTNDPDYISWREPPLPPPGGMTYSWDIFKVDAAKAVQNGKTYFKFTDRKYVNWW